MRIPLIVAARPSPTIKCPSVHLRTGKWIFESNHVDSVLHIDSNGQRMEITGVLELFVPSIVSVICSYAGKEPFITVYACLYH
jgi:hypothetical protein